MMEYPWWQWVSGAGLRQLTRPRSMSGKIRYAAVAPFVVGQSPYLSDQRVFGNTQFCAPIPAAPPDADPADPYIAGRRLRASSIDNTTGYAPTFNLRQYNLATFVVDSSLPEGPVTSGGGGYYTKRLWQSYRPAYYIKRGGGLYQPLTDSVAVPIGYGPATGTDESASILDVNGFRVIDTWHTRQSDGDIAQFPWVGSSYTTDGGGNRIYSEAVPAGEWSYWTCGVCDDTRTSTGAFAPGKGNVVASGMIGMALQLGIDETMSAAGLRRHADGSITTTTPVIDAIQHVIGIELAATVAEGPAYSWPATFSDGYVTPANQMLYGQRLFFDLTKVDLQAITDPLARALTWTGGTYGFIVTDKGGNFAIRGEHWQDPGGGVPDPWDAIFAAPRTRQSTIRAMPWEWTRSMPVDFGKPGTPTAGLLSPLGIPA